MSRMLLMTTAHNDDDWLGTADTLPAPASVPPARPGVYRCEAEGELSTRYDTLIAATAEPPGSPEARIIAYGDEGPVLLAESTSHDERVGWRITMTGAVRLQRESRGEVAA